MRGLKNSEEQGPISVSSFRVLGISCGATQRPLAPSGSSERLVWRPGVLAAGVALNSFWKIRLLSTKSS